MEIDENAGAMRVMGFDRVAGLNTGLTFRGKELKFQAAGGASVETRLTIEDTGNATFSGNLGIQSFVINSNSIYRTTAGCGGLKFTTNNSIIPTDNTGTNSDAAMTLGGGASQRFKHAHFSGTVNASRFDGSIHYRSTAGAGGIGFDTANNMLPYDNAPSAQDALISIGSTSKRFKHAHFSGTVNAATINGKVTDVPDHVKAITPTQIANWDAGTGGGGGGATTDGRISDTRSYIGIKLTLGEITQTPIISLPATTLLAGTSYTKAESDAKYELKGAGLPDGDWHCTGSITAAGNITAYSASDERLKDDIAPCL